MMAVAGVRHANIFGKDANSNDLFDTSTTTDIRIGIDKSVSLLTTLIVVGG